MIGLGLGLSRLSSILGGVIKKGLQMWLGFAKGTVLSNNSINLESRFASTAVGIVSPVVVEGPREISFDDTHFEQFNQEMASVNTIYSQTYSSAYITAGTLITLSGNVTQRDSTSTWNGLDVTRDGYLEFRLSTNTIVKVYIDAAHSVASDGLNIDATTGFFSVSLTLTEGATQFLISAYDIKADDESDPGVRISNLSLSSSSTDNVLGKELVVNGDFATDSNWTKAANSGWSIANGTAIQSGGTGQLYQEGVFTAGKTYSVTVTIDSIASGTSLKVVLGSQGSQLVFSNVGTTTLTGIAANDLKLYLLGIRSGFSATISNISVKEVAQFAPDKSLNTNEAKLLTGKALEFNGNDTVSLGSKGPTNTTAFSCAFWVKPTLSSSSADRSVLRYGKFDVWFYHNTQLHVYPDVAGAATVFTIPDATGKWQRFVLSISGLKTSLYIDGVLFETKDSVAISTTLGPSFIAAHNNNKYLTGLLSDLQIYDKNWTSADAVYDYANPNNLATDNPFTSLTLSNLSAYYALSEGSGNIAFDSTGLGAELVTNGDFASSGSGWTVDDGTSWTFPNNTAFCDGNNGLISSSITSITGRQYQVTFNVLESSLGELRVRVSGGAYNTSAFRKGSYSIKVIAGNSGASNILFYADNGWTGSIDNVSVKLLKADDGTGAFKNEASPPAVIGATWVDKQPTIPQLGMMDWSKGSNLFLNGSNLTDSSWTKSASVVTLTSEEAPDGTTDSVHRLVTTVGAGSNLYADAQSSGVVYTMSFYIKSGGNSLNDFKFRIGSVYSSVITATSEWVRHSFTQNAGSSLFSISTDGTDADILIWGAQLEQSSALGSHFLTAGSAAIDATLIQNPNDIGKDVLGNSLRLRKGGFNLDGIGYAEVADDASLDFGTGNFSIETWAKAGVGSGSLSVIVSLGGSFNGNNSAGIATHKPSGKFISYIGGAQMYSNDVFVVGDWYHLVITRDSGTCTLYVDTVAQNDTETNTNSITNALVKQLGRDTSSDRFYTDVIDDTRIYKGKALSQVEINNNYKIGLSKHS